MQIKAFSSSRSASRGVSLIEVLVSVLILGIGLLGIAAMQALALGNSQSSVERTQAVIHSYSILDAMRANRDDAIAGNYSSGLICPGDAVPGAGISGADLATWITVRARQSADRLRAGPEQRRCVHRDRAMERPARQWR